VSADETPLRRHCASPGGDELRGGGRWARRRQVRRPRRSRVEGHPDPRLILDLGLPEWDGSPLSRRRAGGSNVPMSFSGRASPSGVMMKVGRTRAGPPTRLRHKRSGLMMRSGGACRAAGAPANGGGELRWSRPTDCTIVYVQRKGGVPTDRRKCNSAERVADRRGSGAATGTLVPQQVLLQQSRWGTEYEGRRTTSASNEPDPPQARARSRRAHPGALLHHGARTWAPVRSRSLTWQAHPDLTPQGGRDGSHASVSASARSVVFALAGMPVAARDHMPKRRHRRLASCTVLIGAIIGGRWPVLS